MRLFVSALSLIILLPTMSFGSTGLWSTCDGSEITITLEVFNDNGESYEGLEIMVTSQTVGLCDAAVILETPSLPMPPFLTMQVMTFSVPAPQPDQFYTFSASVVLPDGTWLRLYPGTHAAGCGAAIAARGFLLSYAGEIIFSPCPDSCWDRVVDEGGLLDFNFLSPDVYEHYVDTNIAVDLYGIPYSPYPMPGSPQLYVEQILPAADGACGPVMNEKIYWEDMKAMYR